MTDRITSASLLELVRAQLQEAEECLGHTLDEDFGFWSAPSNTKYRAAVWNAFKVIQNAIESLTGEGDLGGPLRCAPLEVTTKMVDAAMWEALKWDFDGSSDQRPIMRRILQAASAAAPIPSLPSEEELREVLDAEWRKMKPPIPMGERRIQLCMNAMRTILHRTRTETELEAAGEGK